MKIFWTVLRIIIGSSLIIFLLWRFDINKIIKNLSGLNLGYLLFAMVPYLLFIIIATWRWQVLLAYKDMGISFGKALKIYLISLFFNNFLPTTIGGDVMRVFYSIKDKKSDALAVVLVDRILGFIGVFIFGIAAVLYLIFSQRRAEFLPLMIFGLLALVLITFLLFSERAYSLFSPIMEKIKIFKLGQRFNNLHRTLNDFGGAWGVIMLCIGYSIIIQGLLAIAPFLILRSMGNFDVGILPFFIYLPIINVVSMLPVSLNGLGLRENSYVLLFARVGLEGDVAITLSLVSLFLILSYSLIGGICFIFYKRKQTYATNSRHAVF